MEKTIKSAKAKKVDITTESTLTNIFVNVTAQYHKKTFADGEQIANEHLSGVGQVQFNLDNLDDAVKVKIAELITAAIEDAKVKIG